MRLFGVCMVKWRNTVAVIVSMCEFEYSRNYTLKNNFQLCGLKLESCNPLISGIISNPLFDCINAREIKNYY